MVLCSRFLVILLLLWTLVSGKEKIQRNRSGKHIFSLLGYLYGYKMGFAASHKIPAVIIIPLINQHQSVTFNKNENYDTQYEKIKDKPDKTVINSTKTEIDDYDIEVDINSYLKRDRRKPVMESNKLVDSTIQSDEKDNSSTTSSPTSIMTPTAMIPTNNLDITTKIGDNDTNIMPTNTSTTIDGLYPTPNYNNEFVNSINLINNEDLELPPVTDERWQNFSSLRHTQKPFSNSSTTIQPTKTESEWSPTEAYGRYTAALYDNVKIEHVSLTTEKDPITSQNHPEDWHLLHSSKIPSINGFKPLAGLYYDGFLHKPLKKISIVPNNFID